MENGLADRVLSEQAWRAELGFLAPIFKEARPNVISAAGRQRQETLCSDQIVYPNQRVPQLVRDPASKNKVERNWGSSFQAFAYVFTHNVPTCTRLCPPPISSCFFFISPNLTPVCVSHETKPKQMEIQCVESPAVLLRKEKEKIQWVSLRQAKYTE